MFKSFLEALNRFMKSFIFSTILIFIFTQRAYAGNLCQNLFNTISTTNLFTKEPDKNKLDIKLRELEKVQQKLSNVQEGIASSFSLPFSKIGTTPLVHSWLLSGIIGSQVWIKFDNEHPTGSFKERGVLNFITSLTNRQKQKGLVVASTGNQGVAFAYWGKQFGISTKIIVSHMTNPTKIEMMRSFDAEVIQKGKTFDDAYHIAERLSEEEGRLFVPKNNQAIFSGEATLPLEILQALPDTNLIIGPARESTLMAATAEVAIQMMESRGYHQNLNIIGVHLKNAEPMAKPTKIKKKKKRKRRAETITTASARSSILTQGPIHEIHEIFQKYIDKGLITITTASERSSQEAIRLYHEIFGQVIEKSGALSLAAILNHKIPQFIKDQLTVESNIVLIVTGQNLDGELAEKLGIFSQQPQNSMTFEKLEELEKWKRKWLKKKHIGIKNGKPLKKAINY